jgi:hypothetical protein
MNKLTKLQHYKKIKTLKKTLKKTTEHEPQKNNKTLHYYYISRCLYNENESGLDDSILEYYLKKLGLIPNNRAMKFIETEDMKIVKEIQKKDKNFKHNYFCKFNQLKYYNNKNIIDKLIVGNNKINNTGHTDVFFYNINSKFLNKRFYKYQTYLLNILNIDFLNITTKQHLYNYIQSKKDLHSYKKYFIETFPINDFKKYHFPKYYILRPNDSLGGKDIIYINTQQELQEAINFYKHNRNYKGNIYGNEVIASPYITNLLLFQGKKFHLRMYYILSCINGIINYNLMDNYRIYTAKEKFNMEPPFSTLKHDTHSKSTEKFYTFKKDFNKNNLGIDIEITENIKNNIFNSSYKICGILTKMILEKTGADKIPSKILFNNQQNGYFIFGIDMFITNDFEPILIECNEQPGFSPKFSKEIYSLINDIILTPLFKK